MSVTCQIKFKEGQFNFGTKYFNYFGCRLTCAIDKGLKFPQISVLLDT